MSTHEFQYLYFTSSHQPPSYQKKKEANPNTRNSSLYLGFSPWPSICQSTRLGHLPSPCSMKNPTLSTTLNWDDPQPPDPTFIHIKWDDPHHVYSSQPLRITNQPFRQPSDPRAELRFCSSPSKLQSLMVPSLEASRRCFR